MAIIKALETEAGMVSNFLFSEVEEILFLIQFCLDWEGGSSFARFGLCLGLCS